MHRILLLLVALIVSVGARADEPDATRVELNTAKQTFADTTGKAKTNLLAAIDDTIKTVAAAGDLTGVKAIQSERKAFEESGKLPATSKLGTAVGEYSRATKAAKATLDKAYDRAVKEYTKGLKIELAEAVQKEWKEFGQPTASIKPVEKEPVRTPPVPQLIKDRALLAARLAETTWSLGNDGNRVKFKANGTAVLLPGTAEGNWVALNGNQVIIAWPGAISNHDLLTFDPTFKSMKKIWVGDTSDKHAQTGKLVDK
jgi:hypothetical protein